MTRGCQVVHPAPLTEEAEGHPLTNLVPTLSLNPALLVTILSPCPPANPCPKVTTGDAIRLLRNKKGPKRPPDTYSEEWRNMSRNQRDADIERYQAKLKREAAARAEEERDAAPAYANTAVY